MHWTVSRNQTEWLFLKHALDEGGKNSMSPVTVGSDLMHKNSTVKLSKLNS